MGCDVHFIQLHTEGQGQSEVKPGLVWVEVVGPGGRAGPSVGRLRLYEYIRGTGSRTAGCYTSQSGQITESLLNLGGPTLLLVQSVDGGSATSAIARRC